ncbi:thioredoxin [Thermospira aquatica]|uniref:Thioredoxin n=1 Tax=Thermospira aquatica TaxID=2828656 RepID=A0AAX3BFD7_9SPIR|nr:thioredoxin [Thermospira aquatica]URA11097.1 thioredoxin [Thermospira aquatica]
MEQLIDAKTRKELSKLFEENLTREVEVKVYSTGDEDLHEFARQFPSELAEISSKVHVNHFPARDDLTNPTVIVGENLGYNFRFLGTPYGHEASTIIEVIRMLSQGKSSLAPKYQQALQRLDRDVKIQVFVTPSCPYCPQAALLAAQVMLANPQRITVEVVEAQENPELSMQYRVSSVPQQVINGAMDSITIGVQRESNFVEQVIRYGSGDPDIILKEMNQKNIVSLPDHVEGEIELSEENFDEALKKYPRLVVDFWAEWCMPCKMMAPIFATLAEEDHTTVYAKCNVDENPSIAERYGINSIPTIGVFKSGQLSKEIVGVRPKAQLVSEIEKALA